ncbi:hypothetical protein WR25_12528 [Diploscapter pachys]|uniref:Tetraspanin n=1 Tax=Diploscapter pachys TaxID=2018661 RepID=A0A2A2JUU7_9BILA|nr:hypothetical protein WR25_12528 [Diploscapter pachys]
MLWTSLPMLNYSPLISIAVASVVFSVNLAMIGSVRKLNHATTRISVNNIAWRTLTLFSVCIPLAFAICMLTAFAYKLPGSLANAVHLRMRQIANDPKAKIDDEYLHDIQIEMSCCGVHGPKDYLALHDVDLIDGENSLDEELSILPPLSCCISFDCSKYSAYLVNNGTDFEEWYQPDGCVNAAQKLFGVSYNYVIPAIFGFSMILQAVTTVCCQYCFSSYATLHDSGLPNKAISFGYLMDFGYPTFKDLLKDMNDFEEERLEEKMKEEKKKFI